MVEEFFCRNILMKSCGLKLAEPPPFQYYLLFTNNDKYQVRLVKLSIATPLCSFLKAKPPI